MIDMLYMCGLVSYKIFFHSLEVCTGLVISLNTRVVTYSSTSNWTNSFRNQSLQVGNQSSTLPQRVFNIQLRQQHIGLINKRSKVYKIQTLIKTNNIFTTKFLPSDVIIETVPDNNNKKNCKYYYYTNCMCSTISTKCI